MSPLNNNQIQVINNSSTIATAKSLRLYDLNSLPNELILKIFDELKYTHGALVRSCKRFWELATKRHSLLAFAYFIFNNKPLSKKVSYASPLTKEDVPFFKELIEECQVNFNELLINPSLNSFKTQASSVLCRKHKFKRLFKKGRLYDEKNHDRRPRCFICLPSDAYHGTTAWHNDGR